MPADPTSAKPESTLWSRWIPILSLAATTTIGVLQIMTKQSADAAQHTAQEAKDASDRLIRERELTLKDREVSLKQDETVYKYVIEAIEAVQKDQRAVHRITLANILVNNMASENYHQPISLLLKEFVDSFSPKDKSSVDAATVKDLASKANFYAKQTELPPVHSARPNVPTVGSTAEPYGQWDIDVFWCESAGDSARKAAEAAVTYLQSEKKAAGRIRARAMPESMNARQGFRISQLEIRIDQDDAEISLGERLKKDLSALVKANGKDFGLTEPEIQRGFTTRVTKQNTKWYVSAFFCRPAAAAGA